MLLKHPDHAALAGAFADHWGNELFPKPEPFEAIQIGVARHDDAWAERDAAPELTHEGLPSAFSKELVGTYDAFEEIDFEDYLKVRGNATEAVAKEYPFSAALISMHTENLLTEQLDRDSLNEEQLKFLDAFLEGQRNRQVELFDESTVEMVEPQYIQPENLQLAFKFLQCCDSLSLTVCVRFPDPIALRHEHPTTTGESKGIMCYPLGEDRYRLDPYPFDTPELTFEVPYQFVPGKEYDSVETFRKLYAEAPIQSFTVTLTSKEA